MNRLPLTLAATMLLATCVALASASLVQQTAQQTPEAENAAVAQTAQADHKTAKCGDCDGAGSISCGWCGGDGIRGEKQCGFCVGKGTISCVKCGGDGKTLAR